MDKSKLNYFLYGIVFLVIFYIILGMEIYNVLFSFILTTLITVIVLMTLQRKYSSFSYKMIYFLILSMILFFRTKSKSFLFNDPNYYIKWINLVFVNKVVFINIIGNIVLYIPLGFILKKPRYIPIGIILITILELSQYVFKLGVFDVYDILLNTFGLVLGNFIKEGLGYERRRKKEQGS